MVVSVVLQQLQRRQRLRLLLDPLLLRGDRTVGDGLPVLEFLVSEQVHD